MLNACNSIFGGWLKFDKVGNANSIKEAMPETWQTTQLAGIAASQSSRSSIMQDAL